MHSACPNGRSPTSVKRNFSIDRDADLLLHRYCLPGQKAMGKFVSRLIFEHHARREERARLAAAPVGCLADDGAPALQGAPDD